MLTFFKKIFIWWNQDTFGTRIQTIFSGKFIGKDNVAMVFDDRQQVVDMWRYNGLTCFQVADGDF